MTAWRGTEGRFPPCPGDFGDSRRRYVCDNVACAVGTWKRTMRRDGLDYLRYLIPASWKKNECEDEDFLVVEWG